MKQILLIGDSIRLGYQSTVSDAMAGIADVWGPESNDCTSRTVLANMQKWIISRNPDIVVLNCGLRDAAKEPGTRKVAVPKKEYQKNLRAIFSQLLVDTHAIPIWATTTPINEQWQRTNKSFDLFLSDVLAYNRLSVNVAKEKAIPVIDLYALVTNAGRDGLLNIDGVHIKPDGYRLIGLEVAGIIKRYLG